MISKRATKLVQYCSFVLLIYGFVYYNRVFQNLRMLITPESMERHQKIVHDYFQTRKVSVTSNLGKYLFKYTNRKPHSYITAFGKSKQPFFNVLIWKHWPWLKKRHTETYGVKRYDPLSDCSVSNCKFSGEDDPEDVYLADAVVVHLQKGFLPNFKRRDPDQLWIFWSDEPPTHTYSLSSGFVAPSFEQLSKLFNWSMTYRSDSDVPVPYGRTLPLPYPKLNDITIEGLKELVPFWKRKRRDVLATIVMTRCVKFRMEFLMRLQRYIDIDLYGKCAVVHNNTRRCPGHQKKDCPVVADYLFYVAIENSKCHQYITEKVFHHSFAKGAIPIIMGAPLEDCVKLLPPNSFIHVDSFDSLQALAKEIYSITNNISRLLSYHAWRNNFETLEEHGFLGTRSYALCRLCEALNYNYRSRNEYSVADIASYLDRKLLCTSVKNLTAGSKRRV